MDTTRLARLRAAMKEAGLDAIFLSNPKNVRYITGVRAMMCDAVQPLNDPEYFVLLDADHCHVLCDGRYFSGAKEFDGVEPQLLESPSSASSIGAKIRELLPAPAKTVGFERHSLLHDDALGLLDSTGAVAWQGADEMLSRLRVVKTADECKLLRQAQDITCDAFDNIVKFLRPGLTEHQVGRKIEDYMRDHSEGNSFHPIVAFGQTACNAHYTPSRERRLEKGHLVLLDFGSIHGGYCGDLTRMVCMGKADDRQREVHELVLAAQLRCLDEIKPGVTTGSLDAACRNYFAEKGCDQHFIHGTGHGVGLAIHEEPRLKQNIETIVEPGMVFTVEPGLYYEDWGGVRIEDMVIVTEDGHDNLTRSPKELVELDV